MHRRRLNIQNYGSHWLKPPGVPKTLHQLHEEEREQKEHAEAMRREQVAQELAEAAAEQEGNLMDDVQLDGAQDLDDEIPDADDDFGFHNDDDDDDDSEDEEDEDDEDEDEDETYEEAQREERRNDLMASQIRMNDDAFREALVRGDPDADNMYGDEEEHEEEDQGNMYDEEDFAENDLDGDDLGIDMDADLDGDIPEAESGGYEHTDSEAELSSSEEEQDEDDEDDNDISFAPRSAALPPPGSPTLHGRSSMSAPPASMDLSNLLSQDGSSFMESSPAGRRARR